ncbi:MAG: hypothetical protein K2X03_23735 [Bryobacteraceae bacterium]|nr:hypothetical protein [Bryobacteraceae bacterium]
MHLWLSFVLAAAALAEDPPPLGIVRGHFIGYEGTMAAGIVTVKLAKPAETAYACRSDGRTYIERDRQRIHWRDVAAGDSLELVTDRTHRLAQCYVRMVHVVGPQPAKYPIVRTERATESFAPRGSIFYSGVVSKVEPGRLWIRTRTDGLKDLRLRPDTRYTANGDAVEREQLLPGMRVYLRAGISWDDDLEIYQVTWGEILTPKP